MEVFLSELAETKLLNLINYIHNKWGKLVRDKFIIEFKNKISQISDNPESCPESSEFQGLYQCVISKQSTLFYRINYSTNTIEIITIFDTRQNPNKLEKEIRNN